ncbi:T9SS type A sorting domain-containing protein [Aquimarina sp. RZ0]|uniref:T9SS type A sorting domain-containing protein n=1 Tax=Aquimarina sp. RZ0 TaxID=2607730 RepID=UPI0011F1829C|nr:T9SS type A sorting domain-containing protein [Aquimarina sp. RZ0]KAA1247529.1 T9SS type A sorting domain-containing protein [Aquimarina sp. RZ0]
MKNNYLLSVFLICTCLFTFGQDWSGVPIPANAGSGKQWQLQSNFSDDFNYNGKGNANFTNKWVDYYMPDPGWPGPGETNWVTGNSNVSGGFLEIRGTQGSGSKVNCGVISSKTKIKYPVYMEARIKASNILNSSNFWLLSQKDNNNPGWWQELDILEVYGGDTNQFFSKQMSTNFHIWKSGNDHTYQTFFKVNPNQSLAQNPYWRDGFHTFGCYWKSPTDITFYIDGVPTSKGEHFVDGRYKNNLNGSYNQAILQNPNPNVSSTPLNKSQWENQITKELFIIIDTESHHGRPISPSYDLNNSAKNVMLIDWIRVYKPVASSGGGGNSGNQIISDGTYYITSPQNSQRLLAPSWANYNARMINPGNYNDQRWVFIHQGNNEYTIRNSGTGRYLQVDNSACTNNANVSTGTSSSGNNRKWKIAQNGGNYSIKPVHCSNLGMDRHNGATNANAQIFWFNSNSNNEKWNIQFYSSAKASGSDVTPESLANGKVMLYPNPAKDILNISLGNSSTYNSIQIIDMLGKVHQKQTINNSDFSGQLKIANLNAGIYFVRLTGDTESKSLRFVKQ